MILFLITFNLLGIGSSLMTLGIFNKFKLDIPLVIASSRICLIICFYLCSLNCSWNKDNNSAKEVNKAEGYWIFSE